MLPEFVNRFHWHVRSIMRGGATSGGRISVTWLPRSLISHRTERSDNPIGDVRGEQRRHDGGAVARRPGDGVERAEHRAEPVELLGWL
jgi:hypothetical protein